MKKIISIINFNFNKKAGASLQMSPLLLCLFLLFGLLFRFPLGVFPLPLLALEKRLYLREQDTGQESFLHPS